MLPVQMSMSSYRTIGDFALPLSSCKAKKVSINSGITRQSILRTSRFSSSGVHVTSSRDGVGLSDNTPRINFDLGCIFLLGSLRGKAIMSHRV